MRTAIGVSLGALVLTGAINSGSEHVAFNHQQQRAPRVLLVPEQFASIQQAIDSARRGDTVLVAPGRYFENIRFKGRSIVVASHFARSRNADDIDRTIIDGSRPAHPDTASVVRIVNQEDSTTVLEGFTITGGRGTRWLDAKDHHHFREGGGVLCELSAPTIRYNRIQDNESIDTTGGAVSAGGGGIRCGYAEPVIEFNWIRRNRARYGAGLVSFHSASRIRHNVIADNRGGQDYGGAGIWVVGSLSGRLPNVVERNTIVRNHATHGGRPLPQSLRGLAGGVFTNWTAIEFRGNIVWGNTQSAGDQFDFPAGADLRLGTNIVEGGINGGPAGGRTLQDDPRFSSDSLFTVALDSPARHRGTQYFGAEPLKSTPFEACPLFAPARRFGRLTGVWSIEADGRWLGTQSITVAPDPCSLGILWEGSAGEHGAGVISTDSTGVASYVLLSYGAGSIPTTVVRRESTKPDSVIALFESRTPNGLFERLVLSNSAPGLIQRIEQSADRGKTWRTVLETRMRRVR